MVRVYEQRGYGGRPLTVTLAAALAVCYSAVLASVAIGIMYEVVTGTGHIGSLRLNGNGLQGAVETIALLGFGAVCLARGAYRSWVGRGSALIVLPLCALIAIGVVGETIDLLGTASGASNAIGAGILVLAALPVILMSRPSSRVWFLR